MEKETKNFEDFVWFDLGDVFHFVADQNYEN